MSDLLIAIQIACVVLLTIGGPAYAVLQLYWRAEAAEYMLRNERLKSSRLEREVQQLRQALTDAERRDTDPLASASDPAEQAFDRRATDAHQPSE